MPTFPTNVTFTPRLQLPRPGLDDPADAPDGFNDLTDILDPIIAAYASGTTAARPVSPPGGSFYWNTDTKTLDFYNGTTWGAASGVGTVGTDLPILDVGMAGQIRAGRQLAVADFTSLGLAQPIGLWNLSGLTNLGSDSQALAMKGTVPFGVGINGLASTSAVFAGSASQALYIAGASAANYNIRTGSFGCWFRTAKRATLQVALSKYGATDAVSNFNLRVSTANVAEVLLNTGAATSACVGISDVVDDRWHFIVGTADGTTVRLYVDGTFESALTSGLGNVTASAPLNVGGYAADAGTSVPVPGAHYGRVDEAFVTADVLTEDQIRALYAARLTHTLGLVPTGVRLNVTRRRKGAPLVVGDFTTSPLRLYNFTAGDLVGVGSDTTGNRTLTAAGTAPISVAGADGTPSGAYSFGGAGSLQATDAGLPATTTTRSYGAWFKTATTASTGVILAWGTVGARETLYVFSGAGAISSASAADTITGPSVADGQWHLGVVVEYDAAGDGVKRKLYLDGRLVGGSTVLGSVTPGGANRFRLGADVDGTLAFTGQIDGAFVTGQVPPLGADDVARLWAKGSPALAPSPKNAGDHVEALESAGILFIGDTLESQHTVDLGVVA